VTTTPVFLVDDLPAGEHAVLDGPEGRHASTVRRMRAGEELMLCDGRGGIAHCAVASPPVRDRLELRLLRRWTQPQPQPRVVVAQALVKGDRGELAVELATEAGADLVLPWRAERCVTRWDDGPRGAKALARWRSTVREAAKQARRAWVPEVTEPVGTAELAALVSRSAGALLLDAAADTPLTGAAIPKQGDVVVIVGPEGGTSGREITALTQAGAQLVRLGPTVLRASTAAAVSIGALGVLTQRWR
jgi:16S rRNA (uracil1498-N3)-methyltransferase